MFVGHLAAALVAKKVEPGVPLGAAIAASFGIDLLWPVFLLLGIETVRVNPGDTAFTHLAFDSYPWSHSLLLVVAWAAAATLIGRLLCSSWRIGAVLGVLVLSHWVLDLITHRPDLPLWPGGPVVGLGLWGSIAGTIVVEGALLALGLYLYASMTTARSWVGTAALVGLVGLTTMIWISQPWAPPPPSATAVALVGLVMWILPFWGRWIEGSRDLRGSN